MQIASIMLKNDHPGEVREGRLYSRLFQQQREIGLDSTDTISRRVLSSGELMGRSWRIFGDWVVSEARASVFADWCLLRFGSSPTELEGQGLYLS